MLMGESQRGLDSNSSCNAPAFACLKDSEGAAEDAACNSEPSQCCWNDAKVGQEGESDSEDNGKCLCRVLRVVLSGRCCTPWLKPERCIFEGVFAM